jgi:FKBP-type peptidyl-prolyl cis-trans isomerase
MRSWIVTGLLFFGPFWSLQAQVDTLYTPSGLKYTIVQAGKGPVPGKDGKVLVSYVGKLHNGRIFDASSLRKKPIKVRLGRGEYIPAWEELLPQLPAGTRLTLFVPARLGYGSRGLQAEFPDEYLVPPDTDLIFELEVLKFLN